LPPVNFLFAVHIHQPVGNLGEVFAEAYSRCYLPFFRILEKHPHVRMSVHISGPVLEWMEEKGGEVLSRIGALAERGQIELLTGGFYEPVLSVIPERDAVGQIEKMSAYLEKRFGKRPTGIWLAERIWEPAMPALLARAGVRFAFLDDTHFQYAGLAEPEIHGYFLTEKNGAVVAVFPILKRLRDAIPFRMPEETLAFLERTAAGRGKETAYTYADDGEKFGLWPGTAKWVYEDGWMEKFFARLAEADAWLKMPLHSEFLAAHEPLGRIYLPAASYEEMLGWALPAGRAAQLEDVKRRLQEHGLWEESRSFIRGGQFENFLVKYEEANHMHKRMLDVSDRLEEVRNRFGGRVSRSRKSGREEEFRGATDALYRAQCNCAYWHGLFGGIYLGYLRDAVYSNLIQAETAIRNLDRKPAGSVVRQLDLNCDGRPEVSVETGILNAWFSPGEGGSLVELDWVPRACNLANVISRRPEAYHRKIREGGLAPHKKAGQPSTVNGDIAGTYDSGPRYSFVDRFLESATTLDSRKRGDGPEIGDFGRNPYVCRVAGSGARVSLERKSGIAGKTQISVRKEFDFSRPGALSVVYKLKWPSRPCLFSTELNFTLLAGTSPDRYFVFPGKDVADTCMRSEGELRQVSTFSMVDEWRRLRVEFFLDPEAGLWRYPIETLSRSEEGWEQVYQGSSLVLFWEKPGTREAVLRSIRVEISMVPLDPDAG
jgi:hypothetical protein